MSGRLRRGIKEPPLSGACRKNFIEESISVDAACSGNPGDMEYRGVYTKPARHYSIMDQYWERTILGNFCHHPWAGLFKENGLGHAHLFRLTNSH